MAGSWLQCVRWKLVPTNTAGKKQQRGIGSNQYGAKIISTNKGRNILWETAPTKWQDICSNQCGGKLVPTNTAGKNNNRELVPTNTAGKFA